MNMRFILEIIRGTVAVTSGSFVMGAIGGMMVAGIARYFFGMNEIDALLFAGVPAAIFIAVFYFWKLWPTQGVKFDRKD